MMMKVRFHASLILAVLLISYGCSGSSKIEMTETRDALNHATNLHADTLAPADFQKAQKAWDSAQSAEKEGKTGKAKVLFTSAKIFFDKAADIAKSRQDALSRKLSEMQLRISKNFDRVRSGLTRNDLSSKQRSPVLAIVSEVEEGNDAISKLAIPLFGLKL
jgi:hypothetical protein